VATAPSSRRQPKRDLNPALALPATEVTSQRSDTVELVDGHVMTFDGVAAVVRGNTMTMLWKASARLPRSRWVMDKIDQLAAREPSGILVLMIILPSAAPPDRETRLENYRRIARFAPSLRGACTVVLGYGVLQTLLRGVIRAMLLPHLGRMSFVPTIETTVDAGVTRLLAAAGPATPSREAMLDDVMATFEALDVRAAPSSSILERSA
jgi:hypothetical protein